MQYTKEVKQLVNMMGEFSNWLIQTELCLWRNLHNKPIANYKPKDDIKDFITVLEHTTQTLSAFSLGVMESPMEHIPKIDEAFFRQNTHINKLLNEIMTKRTPDTVLKLWIHEFSRTQGHCISEILEWKKKNQHLIQKLEDHEDD